MARIFHMSIGSRIGLVASALLMTALNLSAQQAGDADWGPSLPMDELQKMAGTQVSCTVLRIVPSETFPELGNELAQEESVVIVQAGSTRALVVPSGQTQFRVGQNYKLSLQYRTKLTPPSRLGLPNPVGVYNETLYRDRVLYRIARVEALDKELDAYLSPGFLNRFVVPAERIAEITPQMLDRGLKNPLVEQTSHFFVKVPSDRYQIAEVLQPDANFEVRLVHASTGNRAILCLPWNTRSALRKAARGAVFDVGGCVQTLDVTPSGVTPGRFYLSEVDFVESLRGLVNGL